MRKIIKADDVEIENPTGIEPVDFTPEGTAMGDAPWAIFIDPKYSRGDVGRNGARRNVKGVYSGTVSKSNFQNGEECLNFSDGNPLNLSKLGANINPSQWTLVFIIGEQADYNSDGPITRQEIISPVDEMKDVIAPRINANVTSLGNRYITVYENSDRSIGQPHRLDVDINDYARNIPLLGIVTFSVDNGLAIRINGKQKAAAPDDKRPLNFGYQKDAQQLFRFSRAKFGITGVINDDMSRTKNKMLLESIENFLMQKYAIPADIN